MDQPLAPHTANNGKKIYFPKERRLVLDIIRASRSVPAFPLDRTLAIGSLEIIRKNSFRRISWTAIYLKAWGLVSQRVPQLRQCFLTYPWAHLYQHPHSVASVSVHRRDPGSAADRLIFCRVKGPEFLQLSQIQDCLDQAQTWPLPQVFRDGQLLGKFPWPLRNLAWDLMMYWWGRKKSKKIGTFSISSLAGQNSMNSFHPLIVTTSLCFSKPNENGDCPVTLLCDHRVIDGYLGAECLNYLEETMLGPIAQELRTLAAVSQSAKVA